MDEINKALQHLDTTLSESTQKLKQQYCDGIHATTSHFQNIYNDFDQLAAKYIQSLSQPSTLPTAPNPFNTKIVIEVQDGKPTKVTRPDDWNTDIGYLPNRREMYTISAYQFWDKELGKIVKDINVNTLNSHVGMCGCSGPRETHVSISYNSSGGSKRQCIAKHDQLIRMTPITVDNYLNISYNDIYICFNKLVFPEFAFTTGIKYNDMYISSNYNIYGDQYSKVYSKDTENSTLYMAHYCIPDNWLDVYNYFDGIRAMIHSKVFNIDTQRLCDLEEENAKLKAELEQKQTLIDKYKSSM